MKIPSPSITTLKNILFFFLTNFIGFNIGPLIFVLIVKYNLIDSENADFSPLIYEHFMKTVTLFWLICALFSFALFFMKGNWKIFFMLAPIIIPAFYSLSFLVKYI